MSIPHLWQPIKIEPKVLEKHVEAHLIRRVRKLGGECYKWSSQNVRGVPDRICIFPGGTVWFVELKKDKTGRLSPLQAKFFERMEILGMGQCVVLKGKEDVDQWIESLGILERG